MQIQLQLQLLLLDDVDGLSRHAHTVLLASDLLEQVGIVLKVFEFGFKDGCLFTELFGSSFQLRMTSAQLIAGVDAVGDRKSTRLNSSHVAISYAVFCLINNI